MADILQGGRFPSADLPITPRHVAPPVWPVETRQANGLVVTRQQISATMVQYTAYDQEGDVLRRVGRGRPVPPQYGLGEPITKENLQAFMAWRDALWQEAHTAIVAAFPEAAAGRRTTDLIIVVTTA